MSVSVELIPVARALRAMMGEDRYDAWVASMQVKIPTKFEDENDLLLTVRKAGYDADKWGGSYKTHIRGEEFWFFWELVDGKWTAVFGKSDSSKEISAFIRDLESKSQRQLFEWTESGKKVVVVPTQTFSTNFRDGDLLRQTLTEYGLRPTQVHPARIVCDIRGMVLTFMQEGDQPFLLEVRNAKDMRRVYSHLNDINDAYNHNVQTLTYERLKARIEDRGLSIDSEEVAADKSIVITLRIR